jgi:hypothetical protein
MSTALTVRFEWKEYIDSVLLRVRGIDTEKINIPVVSLSEQCEYTRTLTRFLVLNGFLRLCSYRFITYQDRLDSFKTGFFYTEKIEKLADNGLRFIPELGCDHVVCTFCAFRLSIHETTDFELLHAGNRLCPLNRLLYNL